MTSMSFRTDPGPLPFVTIRDAKWANRLVDLPMPLRIHGDGCAMPRQIASVQRVEPAECGSGVYPDNRPLVRVSLVKPEPCEVHAFDGEWGMCAHCGEPFPTMVKT